MIGDTKQSGLGIASLVTFVCVCLIVAVRIIVLGAEQSPMRGVIFLFNWFLIGVGAGLGIAAVVQKRRRKLFAIIGLAANGLLFLRYFAPAVIALFRD